MQYLDEEARKARKRETNRAYKLRNKEKIRAQRKAIRDRRTPEQRAKDKADLDNWKSRNTEHVEAYSKSPRARRNQKRADLKRLFGLTLEQWDEMFESQDRRCNICRSDKPNGKGWHTDHCHESGFVRGILCYKCNVGLGFFNDNPQIFEAAGAYLIEAKKRSMLEPSMEPEITHNGTGVNGLA